MNRCRSIKPLLSLSAGGDLPAEDLRRVQAHLEACASCRREEAEFKEVVHLAGSLPSPGYQLSAEIRSRLAHQAAARLSRASWLDRLALLEWSRPRPAVLASLAAVLLALIALPVAYRGGRTAPGGEDVATVIAVRLDDGAVRLAWRDGRREAYTVYKTTDPRPMARAEVHVVKGNVWTDSNPESSPVVFYRIE